jgi:hypothetical protein
VLCAIVFSFLGDIPGYGMEVTSVRSSWRVVMAVTLGGWLGARVGTGGWNEDDEENADDSEPVTQAEGGEAECDEGNKD